MLFSTSNQYIALLLVLVAGWLLGLASSSGGRKWRERYATEREAHAAARKDADARRAEQDRRIAELERDRERTVAAAPVASDTAPRRAFAARPAYPAGGERRGWFDFGPARSPGR